MKYFLFLNAFLLASVAFAHNQSIDQKPASTHTIAHQQHYWNSLPFADERDFELAERGLLARPEELTILDENGAIVWELGTFSFLTSADYHNSINPSLERQARLNMQYGLYEVTEGIYQVRGYDLAHLTLIKGDTGWIILDALTTAETARAAMQLVTETLGERPIHAIIYSHAHADHFGGVRGLVSQAQVDNGEVMIIAPRDFMEHAVRENVLAGNAMARRASYQYGNTLEKSPFGLVDAAIGKGLPRGMVGLIAPTRAIEADLETLHIDGIEMVFQNTPNTESPSEMNTWFPQFKALWAAENVTATLHNIYTLRGAETRDALAWSKYINELIHHFAGEAEILFASHGWPRWGNQYLIEVLEKQRDLYGYLHNQTLHLANQGVNISNIHEVFTVPEALAQEWYNRGYHGAVSHNIRGVINKYLGFFDMNPATLNMHGTAARGERYVALAGGAEAILINAREAQQRGDYRWAAEVLSHLVFAEPNHTAARLLQADIFEQLGYQAENAGWRNLYLTGAQELRHGIPQNNNATQMGPDIISAIPTSLILDLLAVRMNAAAAEHKHLVIRLVLPDTDEQFLIELKNSNLSNIASIQGNPQVTVTINRQQLDALLLQQISMQELIASGAIQFDNNPNPFFELLGLLEEFPFYFNIITPLE